MAADITKYLPEKLQNYKDGSNESTLVAIRASEYATEALMKAKFYLDFIFPIKPNLNGVSGFVGGCIVGSPNYAMHNSSRRSKFSVHHNGQNYKLYNDAGLNTLAKTEIVGEPIIYKNYIKIRYKVKSAYYVNTDRSALNVGGVLEYPNGVVPQNAEQEYLCEQNTVNLTPYSTVVVKATVTNAEGIYTSTDMTINIPNIYLKLIGMIYGGSNETTPVEPSISSVINYYMKLSEYERLDELRAYPDSTSSLIYLWEDTAFSILASPDGWYREHLGMSAPSGYTRWYKLAHGMFRSYKDVRNAGYSANLTTRIVEKGFGYVVVFSLSEPLAMPTTITYLWRVRDDAGITLEQGRAEDVTIPANTASLNVDVLILTPPRAYDIIAEVTNKPSNINNVTIVPYIL